MYVTVHLLQKDSTDILAITQIHFLGAIGKRSSNRERVGLSGLLNGINNLPRMQRGQFFDKLSLLSRLRIEFTAFTVIDEDVSSSLPILLEAGCDALRGITHHVVAHCLPLQLLRDE